MSDDEMMEALVEADSVLTLIHYRYRHSLPLEVQDLLRLAVERVTRISRVAGQHGGTSE